MTQIEQPVVTLPPSTVPTSSPLPLPPRLFVPVPWNVEYLAAGTRVAAGQSLVIASPTTSHVPLAPAAGIVGEAQSVQLLDGRIATAIEIVLDDSARAPAAEQSPTTEPPNDLAALTQRLRLRGVCANRHTSPDLLRQLDEASRGKVSMLVCNLLDVDTGSSLHAKVIRENGHFVIAGLQALAAALGAAQVCIAADGSLARRASALVRMAGAGEKIKIEELANDYPQSDPTLLLYALSGVRLKPGELPTNVGAVMIDGVAAAAVGRCVDRGEPMLSTPIEIRDSTRARSHVAVAAVGTPLQFVLQSLGLHSSYTLRAGAALRDVRVDVDAIVSGLGELSIDAGLISAPINPDPCIRCGWCVENCPVRIHPAALLEAAQDNDSAMAQEFGLHACIECGICSYVCPSRLPLLSTIRELRRKLGPSIVG